MAQNVRDMDWFSQSPKLNHTEMLWGGDLKLAVNTHKHLATKWILHGIVVKTVNE